MTDELIIKHLKNKKEKGLQELINKYLDLIASIVRYHLADIKIYEEECIDDILLSIWNNIDKYDKSKSSFKNWIASISKNKCIDYKRKYIEKYLNTHELHESIPYIDKDKLNTEIKNEIEDLLSSLSVEDKSLFIQHYIYGYEITEIASNSNKSVTSLYNRISRGRKKLSDIYIKNKL